MIIEYYIIEVYGNTLYYIKDQEHALAISALTGKKTVSRSDFKALEMLGHTFKQVLS